MKLENSVLEDVREAVGLSREVTDFDTDLLIHINSALSELLQNGVVVPTVIKDVNTTWADLQIASVSQDYFMMVPLFVTLSTKIIFDPPPPSTVEHYAKTIDKLLWRLKLAYEDWGDTNA